LQKRDENLAKLTATLKEINFKNSDYIILPCFLFPVLFGVFWPAYLIALGHILFRFNLEFFKKEKFSVILMGIYFALKLLQWPSLETVIFLKTFAGFGFFYFYFCYFNKTNLDKILISACAIYLPMEFLIRNIDHFQNWRILLLYPRPVGFAENSTIMAIILIVFLLTLKNRQGKKWNTFLVVSVLFCLSGMGYVGLIYTYVVSKLRLLFKDLKKSFLILIVLGIAYFVFYAFMQKYIKVGDPLDKLSPRYLMLLLNMKYGVIAGSFAEFQDKLSILIGLPWRGEILHSGTDFGWAEIFFMTGLTGILLYLILINDWIKDISIKVFLILTIFHYNALWMPAGQIFLGYILGHYSNRKNKEAV
jgi:hypothetical protein